MGGQTRLQPEHTMSGIFGTLSPFVRTPSFTQGGQLPTPNTPLGLPWNVRGNIPNIDDLLGSI